MKASFAKEVISDHGLISGSISKKIIKLLLSDERPDRQVLKFVGKSEFTRIQAQIRQKKLHKKTKIRNLPILEVLKDKILGFDWRLIEIIDRNGNKKFKLLTNLQPIKGVNVSLATALFKSELVKCAYVSKYLGQFSYNKLNEEMFAFDAFMADLNIKAGEGDQKKLLKEWFLKGLSGKPLTVLTPVCPDYSYETLGHNLYRFTFNSLGTEIGVTAKKLVNQHEKIKHFFSERNFDVRFIAAVGDFEALSENNLTRMNLTFEQFVKKLQISQDNLGNILGGQYETPLFTDLCGGINIWKNYYKECISEVKKYEKQHSEIINSPLNQICRAREPLLKNWFGQELSFDEIRKMVLKQGAEYTCMGKIALNHTSNCLILGVDHYKMSPFYQLGQEIPVLYLKPNYLLN